MGPSAEAAASRPVTGPVLGADLGGTKLIAGIVDGSGTILERHRRDVASARDPERVLEAIVECFDACRSKFSEPIRAIGIGVAGQIEAERGIVTHAPNLKWEEFPLGARLSAALGIPVAVANDAHTITLGEWKFGEGRGVQDLLCICIGTGVGGGAVVDGRLLMGARGAAGEIGHTILHAHGRKCHCPNRGCLEAYVGGWAIEERAKEEAADHPEESSALVRAVGGLERLTPLAIEEGARRGDAFAQRFLHRTAGEFASGMVGLANAFNPELIVVTGKIAEGFPEFVTAAQEAVRAHCQPPAATARVVPSRLRADAGILGAAEWARTVLPAEAAT